MVLLLLISGLLKMSEFPRISRPKKGETEEDILEQMRQFESNKSSVLPENIRNFSKDGKKVSKFAADRQLKRQHEEQNKLEQGLNRMGLLCG